MRMGMAALALVAALGACGGAQGDGFDTSKKPEIAVFLVVDATDAQRGAVEAKVRALPGVDAVRTETAQEAGRRAKDEFKDDPSLAAALGNVELPSSVRFTTKTLKAYDAIRHGSFAADVRQLPGVEDVIIPCATVKECRATLTPPASPRGG